MRSLFDYTPIARMVLGRTASATLRAASAPEQTQCALLAKLLGNCARTKFGEANGVRPSMTYEEFAGAVPVSPYEVLRPWVMRMVGGERDVLWPGRCLSFAQSSGTSDGKSKYIPITARGLKANHYAGAARSVGLYLRQYPDSHMLSGKSFILGGSFANELSLPKGVKVGDLSATLIDSVNPLVEHMRVPSKRIALMEDWTRKLPALVEAAIKQNVTNISGVPSWFLTVLKQLISSAGATTIHDVWPHLEVFFHGGIAFGPYRSEYAAITRPDMRYWENYNASEGFFACTYSADDPAMILLPDIDVFYEFQDLHTLRILPLWQVEIGCTYSMIISSSNGLWRYATGDTVTIESVEPFVAITIAGRTKCFINAFGEEVMVHNTDAAIERACQQAGCAMANYTAAPMYTKGNKKGCHQWLIEWITPPDDMDEFARLLDEALQTENSDYQAKRKGNIFLAQLQIKGVPAGFFDRWLASTGKLGGQRKVPRLCNDRHIVDQMLAMLRQ